MVAGKLSGDGDMREGALRNKTLYNVQFYFSAVDGWVVGKWDGRGTGATEAAALGRRGALRNKALYNFIFPRTTTRQSGRGAPAQPVKKAAARDAQNGA